MKIQIAGPGCPKCQTTEKNMKDALAALNMDAEVSKVTDYQEMAKLGARLTPTVVIDGNIVLSGRVPTPSEAQDLLKKAG